jgi:hypothetical protein
MPFQLIFRRPREFYFEWIDYYLADGARRSMVWTQGTETWLYREPKTYERKGDLEMGIASAMGLSYGAAYTIPRLLLPNVRGWALTQLRKSALIDKEVFESTTCYHIRGLDLNGDIVDVWIGVGDYLIRRVKSELMFADFSAVTDEIHRKFRINRFSRFEKRPLVDSAPPNKIWKTTTIRKTRTPLGFAVLQ